MSDAAESTTESAPPRETYGTPEGTVRLREVLGRMPDYKPGKAASAPPGVTAYKLSSNETHQSQQHILTMRTTSHKARVRAVDPERGQVGGCTAASASASRGRQLNGEHLRQRAGQCIPVVDRHLLIHLSVSS